MHSGHNETFNYYEILECQPFASIDELKKSYQSLLLKHHPDKQITSDQKTNEIFHRIDEAWKVLRDSEKKRKYDAELKQQKFNEKPIVHETLTRNEFDFDEQNQCYTHLCRCGGYFVLSIEEQNSNSCDEIFIECDECSLVVQLAGS